VEAHQSEWHRRVAIEAFNRTWDLLEQEDRSPADEREMLASAFASRYHWEQVGGPGEWWIGEWQIARVAAALGDSALAIRYAFTALRRVEEAGWSGWRLASARDGMARAYAASGDRLARDHFVALTNEALLTEEDAEEREIIADQLASVPVATSPRSSRSRSGTAQDS
jgi:hypothetical protein